MTPDPTPAGTTNGWLNWLVWTSCWLVIWTTAGLTCWLTVRTAVSRLSDDGAAAIGLSAAGDATVAGLGTTNAVGLRVTAADAEVGSTPVAAVAVAVGAGAGVAPDGGVALEQAALIGSKSAAHNDSPRRTR